MNIDEFKEHYKGFRWNELIVVNCTILGCDRKQSLRKSSAIRNVEKNGSFLCRTCSYTDDGRRKISEATSYSRSDDTKKKMSESKKLYFKTSEGLAARKRLSLLTAKGHVENKFENSKRQGWYPSAKTGKWMFYGSSYELRYIWELDQDSSVLTYETQIGFEWNGRGRCLDVLVTYLDQTKKAVEIKPADRLNEQLFIDQLNDSRENAISKGWLFEIVTELSIGMTYKEIRNWADEFRKTITGINYAQYRLDMNKKKAKKFYDTKIATDILEVECNFCKKTHTVLRLTHDKNIARNGRYICGHEGGHIAGSKSKKKPDPETKQCKGLCGLVLPFESFSKGKAQCKDCRSKIYKQKYHEGKNDKSSQAND